MGLYTEIVKNNIPIESLENDSLVQLFREIPGCNSTEREIQKRIMKTLLERKKLSLLTNR